MADENQNNNQQPDVVIPNNAGANLQLVSKKDFDDHKKDFDFQKIILNWTFGLVVAVLLVCFISFITFIIDAYKFHGDITKEYNTTIKELEKENSDLKLENVIEKLDELEIKLDYLKVSNIKSEHSVPAPKKTN